MNSTLFYTAISQLFISLIISVTFFYAIYKVSTTVLKKRYSSEPAGNDAITVLSIGILFATGILLSASIIPIQNVTRIIQGNVWLTQLKYGLYFGILGFFIVLFIAMLVVWLFGKNEEIGKELSKNNIYIAILLSIIIVSLTIVAKESYMMMLDGLIPYPKIPNYF